MTDYAHLLAVYRRRLAEITPPRSRAHVFEAEMLEDGIGKLEILARRQQAEAPG